MIRVLCVDDHPAVVAGLEGLIRTEPGLVPTGAAASGAELWPALNRTRPDVVLLDFHLPDDSGLLLCHRIKGCMTPAPQVVIFSGYAESALAVPARLARADGLLSKGVPARELFGTIRQVWGGQSALKEVSPEQMREVSRRLPAEDLPFVTMLAHGTSPREVAGVLGLGAEELRHRTRRVITELTRDLD